MDKTIALDFVISPCLAIENQCVEWNQKYTDGRIRLGWECIPHISLYMIVVRESFLAEILEKWEVIRMRFDGFALTRSELTIHRTPSSGMILSWDWEKTRELLQLQAEIVEAFSGYRAFGGGATPFWNQSADPETQDYVRNFHDHRLGDRWNPHITLGFWKESQNVDFDTLVQKTKSIVDDCMISVSSSDLEIFQLGGNCTCKRRIFPLPPQEIVTAFHKTDYKVADRLDRPIRVGFAHEELDRMLGGYGVSSWVFLTAWNPRSQLLDPATNRERNNRLLGLLRANPDWTVLPGESVGRADCGDDHWIGHRSRVGVVPESDSMPWREESFLVLGMDRSAGVLMGSYFQQWAVLVGEIGSVPELVWVSPLNP